MQPELTNRGIYPIIRKFAQALNIQEGYSGDTVGKDGEGKLVALKALSSLASRY